MQHTQRRQQAMLISKLREIIIEDENERQLAIYKVPYGSKLFIDNNEQVKKGKTKVEKTSFWGENRV